MLKIKKRYYLLIGLFVFLMMGFAIPQSINMPVEGAHQADYHPESFWYYPWGRSGTHKGVDIFAKKGTPIRSATHGLVISTGQIRLGGNYVLILGPKWRMHYYAHLNEIKTHGGSFVNQEDVIGTVGDSGNAAGKPPHLHYTIATLFPYFWRADSSPQGWKKIFYLNPIRYLEER